MTDPTVLLGELIPLEFNPLSSEHVRQLAQLFTDYLLEDFERTHIAPLGIPAAFHLRTATLWDGPRMIAFVSVDAERCSVELVYVAPSHRRQRIAETLYRDLKAVCPKELHVKGPLSPAGQALADRVGLPVDHGTEEEQAHADEVDAEMHRALAAHCRHKRGNPARACRACYRTEFKRTARTIVGHYAMSCLLLHEGKAVLV